MNGIQENESTQNGKITIRWLLQILQHYSNKFPWAAKTLFCQIHYWKIIPSIVWHTRRILKNRTMAIYVSLELLRCICMEMKDWKKNFQPIRSIPPKNWWDWSSKRSSCLYGICCKSGRYCLSRSFLVRYCHFRQVYDWGACSACQETL